MLSEDLRLVWRRVRSSLGSTTTLVAILALGIAAAAVTLSVASSVLLRPLPFRDPERLFAIYEQNLERNIPQMQISRASHEIFREELHSFAQLASYQSTQPVTLESDEGAARLATSFVTAGYFQLLGAEAARGRVFLDGDHGAPMAHPVAVVSHAFWQGRLGGDPDVIGRTLALTGVPVTVVGVMPPTYEDLSDGDNPIQIWLPLEMYPITGYGWEVVERRTTRFLSTVARLAPGVSPTEARVEVDAMAQRLAEEFPAEHAGYSLVLDPLRDLYVANFRPAILTLVGSAFFLLLIGCANSANLLLARAVARRRDVAVQLALGLTWRRLVGQMVLEGVGIAIVAAALGLLLAWWGTGLLLQMSPVQLPSFLDVRLDGSVATASIAVALAVGLLFGFLPSVEMRRANLRDLLYAAGRNRSGDRSSERGRRGLIVVEVATAVILLVGAVLMIRSFGALRASDPGFDAERLLTVRTDLPAHRYGEAGSPLRFARRVEAQLETVPGVAEAIVWGPGVPFQALWYTALAPRGAAVQSMEDVVASRYHAVSSGGVSALGLSLLEGREIGEQDREETEPVAVISRSAARALFGDDKALGQRFYRYRSELSGEIPYITVVGVVADAWMGGRTFPGVGTIDVYMPMAQLPQRVLTILVRSQGTPEALVGPVREAIAEVDPTLPLFDVQTMRARLGQEEQQPRFSALLIGGFASLAVLLAGLGLYSVLAYGVRQRTPEVGIRLALGGRPRDVVASLGWQTLQLVLVGLVLGLLGVGLLTRFLAGALYGVEVGDPATYLVATLVMGGVATAGAFLPLLRAARVDPLTALRHD